MPFWKKHAAPAADGDAPNAPLLDAYERGRKDERATRRRHPIFMAGLVVLAAAGASLITLAAMTGSFGDGGAVADQRLAQAADTTAPVIDQAITRTQEVAHDAGKAIKDRAQDALKSDKASK